MRCVEEVDAWTWRDGIQIPLRHIICTELDMEPIEPEMDVVSVVGTKYPLDSQSIYS